jgi:DMSO/TMAO reductase YedYZ molybdopterin-dependent catalytic subunit
VFPNEKFPSLKGVDRRQCYETSKGFFYPIRSIRPSRYSGLVYDFTADGFTMLSPFTTLDCVTSWSVKGVVWEGVAFREIAKLTGVKSEALWVMFHCADGYTAPVPLEDAMVEDSLVATKMSGKPIPVQQGYPARPFIPHLYGWKSAKWLTGIEFLAEYQDGYWEAYSYHERGNIWDEERFKGQGGKHVRHRGLGSVPV